MPLLIADIGGTNARFALTKPEHPFFYQTQTFQCTDFESIEQAIDTYLQAHKIKQLDAMYFSVAGQVHDQSVKFTNNHWHIKNHSLSERYAIKDVTLLNDFTAIAYSLPYLSSKDVMSIGGDWLFNMRADYTIGVIGPGSGLGVGGLCMRNGSLVSLTSEGGHVGFAPENEFQTKILTILQKKFDRVSRERLLSGPGLVNIYEALCELRGVENKGLTPIDISMQGIEKKDTICEQTMAQYFEILGQISGDISLNIGANEGVFIGGGITQRYPEQLIASNFRAGFENKGRYRPQMEKIPTWLITHKNPGLLGASMAAQSTLLK